MKEKITLNEPVFKGKAPGRLDIMGGIADYSGSMVLEMPIPEETQARIALRSDGLLRVHSSTKDGQEAYFECDFNELQALIPQPAQFRKHVLEKPNGQFGIYLAAVVAVLVRDRGIAFHGADILLYTEVPLGCGVSSSASLEVAVMRGLSSAFSLRYKEKIELPTLAQRAENEFVGAPCGIMDPVAIHMGRSRHVVPILCQPATLYEPIEIPENLHFMGIDSGVTHAVSGEDYPTVRTAAFMGYSIIAQLEGCSQEDLQKARDKADWSGLPYRGYLANVPSSDFENQYRMHLPSTMTGAEFKSRFGLVTDLFSDIRDEVVYPVLNATQHPAYEAFRVETFNLLLSHLSRRRESSVSVFRRKRYLRILGELMYLSHNSYSKCGLGHEQTDYLVRQVKEKGLGYGLYGAKISGGGSGGTVVILGEGEQSVDAVRALHAEYEAEIGQKVAGFY